MTEKMAEGLDPMDEEGAWLRTLIESCEPPDDGFSTRVLQSLPYEPRASVLGAIKGNPGSLGLRLHDLLDPNIWQLYVWTCLAMAVAGWLSSGLSSWMSVWMFQDTLGGMIK